MTISSSSSKIGSEDISTEGITITGAINSLISKTSHYFKEYYSLDSGDLVEYIQNLLIHSSSGSVLCGQSVVGLPNNEAAYIVLYFNTLGTNHILLLAYRLGNTFELYTGGAYKSSTGSVSLTRSWKQFTLN